MSANRFCPLLGEAHDAHEFDYSEDGAHYAGHCDGDDSPYAGGATLHLAAMTGNHEAACGAGPAALTTGNPDDVTCNRCSGRTLTFLLHKVLMTSEQADAWIYAMHLIGYGAHPDDAGRDIVKRDGSRLFTDEEADLYDARMDEAHNLCGDVYLMALDAFEGGQKR